MGELLTDLVEEIRRLFMLMYSGQYTTIADDIAKDAFIDGGPVFQPYFRQYIKI